MQLGTLASIEDIWKERRRKPVQYYPELDYYFPEVLQLNVKAFLIEPHYLEKGGGKG